MPDGSIRVQRNPTMNSAQERAQEIRRRYRFSHPQDIERVLEGEKLSIVRPEFDGRIDEMLVNDVIGIRLSLGDPRRVRELEAHALGHYLLHAGNQPLCYSRGDRILAKQWERQAWAFAYELLMPARQLAELLRKEWGGDEIREYFEVTEEFYRDRKQAFQEEWRGRAIVG